MATPLKLLVWFDTHTQQMRFFRPVLLCLAFLFAVILISIASVAVWGTIFGALLISDI